MKLHYKIFWACVAVWLAACLAPFAFAGESWGMIWFPVNCPAASFIKESGLFEWQYPVLYIAVTSIINALVVGCVCATTVYLFRPFLRDRWEMRAFF
jgi:hypothetical protein